MNKKAIAIAISATVLTGLTATQTLAGDWEGVYVGAFGGNSAIAGSPDLSVVPRIEFTFGDVDFDYSSAGYGVRAGYDMLLSSGIVVGVYGDYLINSTGQTNDPQTPNATHKVNSESTFGVRVGYDGGIFMPYAFVGAASASVDLTLDNRGPSVYSGTHTGYSTGAGVEIRLGSSNTILDLQYRTVTYTDATYSNGPGEFDNSLSTSTMLAGINFRF